MGKRVFKQKKQFVQWLSDLRHFLINVEKASPSSLCSSGKVTNPTSIHEDGGLIPGLAQWVKDLTLLWLWCKSATIAPI